MFRGNEQDGRGLTPAGVVSGHLDDWEDLAVDYVDERLDPATKAAVEAHLDGCPACAARLQTQRGVLAFLHETALDDAPADMEDRVLGEILFPSQAVQTIRRPVADEPSRWSMMWHGRIRPWVPATVAVVALLAAMLSYGLLRSGSQPPLESAHTTTAFSERAATATDSNAQAAPGATATTAATSAATALGAGATSSTAVGATYATAAEITTTTVAAATTTMAPKVATVETIQDRNTMVADLQAAGAPVYLVFQAASATTGSEASTGAGAAVATQITALTGLEPLDETLTLGGPTFAAYLPRDDAAQLVDLLRSIGTDLGLTLSLAWEPLQTVAPDNGDTAEFAARLAEMKAKLPELSAYRTPQPAVSGWSFTTSTLVPASETPPDTGWATPDEAGTHVLIVIYVQK